MTTQTFPLRDSATMLRRNLRHLLRYPGMTISVVAMPVIFLLLFLYVLGGALGAGLAGADHGHYITYLAPGIIVLAVVRVDLDRRRGQYRHDQGHHQPVPHHADHQGLRADRPRRQAASSRPWSRAAVVTAVTVALGFRPAASLAGWIAVFGLVLAAAFALTWLSVAMGLVAKTPENASNLPMPLMFLPFLGSAFVPAQSMAPAALVRRVPAVHPDHQLAA